MALLSVRSDVCDSTCMRLDVFCHLMCSYAWLLGHRTPSFLRTLGLEATYSTTLLRHPVDYVLHVHAAKICKAVQAELAGLNMSLTQQKLKKACSKPQYSTEPTGHKGTVFETLMSTRTGLRSGSSTELSSWHWVSQVDWLRDVQKTVKGDVHSTGTRPVAEAERALQAMPWFGILHHWIGSTCLWHFMHDRPFPYQEQASTPDAGGYNPVAAAGGLNMQLMPVTSYNESANPPTQSYAMDKIGIPYMKLVPSVEDAEHHIRHESTTAILREVLLEIARKSSNSVQNSTASDSEELLINGRAGTSHTLRSELALFDFAKDLFGKRMRQAAETMAGTGRPPYLPQICFKEPPPNGFKLAVQ